METKASYIVVGLATILAVAMFFGLLMFALNKDPKDNITYYMVVFEGGVSGLSIGNDVRFNGIRVGEVRQIDIDKNDPSRVRVIISVIGDVPVREDSEARLDIQGITGLAIVYITGGTADSPELEPKYGEEYAVIKSTRSALEMMMSGAPDLIDSANQLVRRGVAVLSPENEQNLKETLQSLAVMSKKMEQQSKELEAAMNNIINASEYVREALQDADNLLKKDFPEALHTFKEAFARFDAVLAKAEPGIERLTTDVVYEVQQTLKEANLFLRNINQTVLRLNTDPKRFFFGDNVPVYEMK